MTRDNMSTPPRGQSLLELALILPVILLLLAGIVEIGFFINEYIDVIDATREAARFGTSLIYNDTSTYDNPSDTPDKGVCTNSTDPFQTTHFYYVVACLTQDNLKRIEGLTLDIGDPAKGVVCDDCRDDIVISVFSFDRSSGPGSTPVVRFPDSDGWSYSRAIMAANPAADNGPGCRALDINGDAAIDAGDYCASHFADGDVGANLVSGAPNAGLVLVEVYYHHYQVLNLPFFNLLANPLRVHAYSFFPNPSAEPSATN